MRFNHQTAQMETSFTSVVFWEQHCSGRRSPPDEHVWSYLFTWTNKSLKCRSYLAETRKVFCIRMRRSCSRASSRASSPSPDSVFHLNFPSMKHKNSKSCGRCMVAKMQRDDSLEERCFCEVINLTNQVRSGTLYSPQWTAANANTTTTMAAASPLLLRLHALITPRVRYTGHKKELTPAVSTKAQPHSLSPDPSHFTLIVCLSRSDQPCPKLPFTDLLPVCQTRNPKYPLVSHSPQDGGICVLAGLAKALTQMLALAFTLLLSAATHGSPSPPLPQEDDGHCETRRDGSKRNEHLVQSLAVMDLGCLPMLRGTFGSSLDRPAQRANTWSHEQWESFLHRVSKDFSVWLSLEHFHTNKTSSSRK